MSKLPNEKGHVAVPVTPTSNHTFTKQFEVTNVEAVGDTVQGEIIHNNEKLHVVYGNHGWKIAK